MRLSRVLCLGLTVFASFLSGSLGRANAAQTAPRQYFYEPAISHDGSEIAFVSGGDVWTVPASGGDARLLVSHPATEYRPLFSPDSRRIAFTSARTGNGDVYLLTLATGELRRLTYDDGFEQLDSWSRDGRWLYFSSNAKDIAGNNDLYRVSVEGGTPMQVSADRYANEFGGAPSPDGAHVAFVGRGYSQWWRKGHAHIDESELWLMRNHSTASYERLTNGGAKELWPMWSPDGRTLFYVSDRSGAENVWSLKLDSQPRQLTRFDKGRVLWPSISNDGRTMVFERDFGIWKMDAASGRASQVAIALRGAAAGPGIERVRQTDRFQELALSPDGKKIAFVARGEVFAASASEGGDAARVTTTAGVESQPAWSPDSRKLVYVSERNGAGHIFLYDFTTNTETQLTNGATGDSTPLFSPDGKLMAFERDGRELRVLELDSKRERVVATARLRRPPFNSDRPYVWSPDSRFIAFMPVGEKLFRNVFIAQVAGGETRPVSFLANVGSNTVSWSPDGTFILFDTGQRTEAGQLARVELIPRLPKFREDQFRELFKEETPKNVNPTLRRQEVQPQSPVPPRDAPNEAPSPAPSQTPAQQTQQTSPAQQNQQPAQNSQAPAQADARKPTKQVEIVYDGVRRRMSLLPVGVDVFYQTISPDGKWVLMIAGAINQMNLYVYSLDELAREPAVTRQLTSTSGFKSFAQFSPDSREVFYLESGRIFVAPLDPRQQPRPLAVAAELDVEFEREKLEVFRQGWSLLRDGFYDPGYHGADWGRVRAEYQPFVEGARTPDDVRRLMRLMVGELNASHLGVSSPAGSSQTVTGRIGLDFDREEYERTGRLRVVNVVPLSPAAIARETSQPELTRAVRVGEYLLSVDGKAIDASVNLDDLLNHKINRRVSVTVASSPDGAGKTELDVRPVNLATEKGLRYRAWVEGRREYVARASGGRLGYVHMFDMSSASLSQLYLDLDAENQAREGVVVDVRQNNGGFVNVYAVDVLARRSYLRMTPRGLSTSPGRTVLGQRALELPTVLVTDKHSLSDAEDFAEGYRSLRLGKVVGEPTAGWIIYTSNISLIDGTVFRIPFMKVETSDGVNMERNPRPVDVHVSRSIGESYGERDSQLDAAVRELLGQLSARGER